MLPLVFWACGGSTSQTVELREAVAAAGAPAGPAVALRLPSRPGTPRLYDLPALQPLDARFTAGPAVDRIVGFAGDDDFVYAMAGTDLAALDLRTGRYLTLDSAVTRAGMAPTGAVLLARADGSLGLAADRRVGPAPPLPAVGSVEEVWPLPAGRLAVIARGDSGRELHVVGGGTDAARRVLPEGPVTHSPWGDVVAVASPEGVLLVEVLADVSPHRVRVRADLRALAFSASGHRLYVATTEPEILVFERYEGDGLARIRLEEPATELRADPFGRYLFAAVGQGIALVTLGDHAVSVMDGAWGPDLPTAGPDGTVLLVRGEDVVAVRPGEDRPRGVVRQAAADHWIIAPVVSRGPAVQLAGAARGEAGRSAAGGAVFVQVSSTSNAQWAEGLAADLRTAGMQARVLPPANAEEMYRVVLGPYPTREAAEAIGRKLDMPYWIFQRDTTAGAVNPS
jgi:SPOR domain